MAGTERPSLIQNLIPLGWMCLQSGNEKVKRIVYVGKKTDSKTMYREQMGQGNSGETGSPRTTNSLCNKFQINVSEWKAKRIELGHNLFNFFLY